MQPAVYPSGRHKLFDRYSGGAWGVLHTPYNPRPESLFTADKNQYKAPVPHAHSSEAKEIHSRALVM